MSKTTLAALDASLYPQVWAGQMVADANALLLALLKGHIRPDANAFAKRLLADTVYQEWVNFTVFGRYLQRSFDAFYRQSEDSFNADLPDVFRRELMRHAQYLPKGQLLFFAAQLPSSVRQEKLLTTTLNPATAMINAQKPPRQRAYQPAVPTNEMIINQVKITGDNVLAFPIRHNTRTRERSRNEVLILDFHDLRLVAETTIVQEVMLESSTAPIGSSLFKRFWQNTPSHTDHSALLEREDQQGKQAHYCLRQYELK